MVKADAERDLYADLELLPGADPNDIKRAFKKLGIVIRLRHIIPLLTLDDL